MAATPNSPSSRDDWILVGREALWRYRSMTKDDTYGRRWASDMVEANLGPSWVSEGLAWEDFVVVIKSVNHAGPLAPLAAVKTASVADSSLDSECGENADEKREEAAKPLDDPQLDFFDILGG